MHQSTVCRSLQHLPLGLPGPPVVAGQLRIGTDLLHQSLLLLLPGVQQVPHRFRSAAHWAELIRHGLLDAAIISSPARDKPLLSGKAPQWEGLTAMPLGQLSLQLVASTDCARRALLPRKVAMPLLHQAVMSAGFLIEQQPAACQELAA